MQSDEDVSDRPNGANYVRVFHLEAFRFLMERGSRKVP